MLQKIKQLPLVLPLRQKLYDRKFATHRNVHYFRGVFNTFTEAESFAPSTKPIGYNHPAAAKMYQERTQVLYSTDYPVLFWMEKFKSNIRSVFDFGGHVGIHYYSYPKALDLSLIDQWTVCDVESVCEEGRVHAHTRDEVRKLSFVSNVVASDGYDLFLANGSLQYLEWELHQKLLELNELPKYIIFNMTPLHPTLKTITLNNIGTAFCPYHLRVENQFLRGLESIGYEILDLWTNESKSCLIAFEDERSLKYYRGGILKLASARV